MSEIINDNIPEEEEAIIVELEDEDGNTTEFEYLDTIGYDGEEFVVLIENDETADGVVILKIESIDDETENYNDRYNKWPGDMFTTKDANGWYNKTYEVDKYDDSFNIIISKCTGTYSNPVLVMQSADCRDIIYNEIWAVIDDTRDDVSFNVYNVNPDTNPGAEPVAHV